MVDQTLLVKDDLPLDEFGILGVGAFAYDYFIQRDAFLKNPEVTFDGKEYKIEEGVGIRVRNGQGDTLLTVGGPYTPDRNTSRWGLLNDEKHNSGTTSTKTLEFVVGQNASVTPGGGIINFARAWLSHSSEIPIGITVLRGRGRIDDLIEGAFSKYVAASEDRDQGNIIIPDRTVIRGSALSFTNHIFFKPNLPFNIGTVVINSLDSRALTEVAINYYLNERRNGHYVGGIIAITPKMANSYDVIAKEAIPAKFIPVFSPTDLVNYAFRENKDNPALKKAEDNLTYGDIISAVQKVRAEQGHNPQRIYVTLGKYGALAIGTSGTVYRNNSFDATGNKLVGAGDNFASAMSRFEHKRNLSMRHSLPVYAIMAYSSAAAVLHIDGQRPSMGAIYQRLNSEGSMDYECIGPLAGLDANSTMFNRTLSTVGNAPVTGRYDTLKFR